MRVYNTLSDDERGAIEEALDLLAQELVNIDYVLANDDRAARAAEALAVYLVESRFDPRDRNR